MSLAASLNFWTLKLSRTVWYNIRYRLNKWIEIKGVQFPVYPEYGYGVLRFIDSGQYESGEIEIISKTLEPGDRALELGTGLGFISTYCSKKIGSENVHTFEANVLLEKRIRELYERNGVDPHLNFAILGKENGKTTFYRDTQSLLASSLKSNPGADLQPVEVAVKKLNEVIAEIRPTYLIMDIEGGEQGIFEEIDFQTIRKIQFELHPGVLGPGNVAAIFRKLEANHFRQDESFQTPNNYYFYKEAPRPA